MRTLIGTLLLFTGLAGDPPGAVAQSTGWMRIGAERIPAVGRLIHESQTWRDDAGGHQAEVEVVRFEAADAEFRVLDQGADGDRSLGDVMGAASAQAGINGGYFHPDRQPLGLLVSDGATIHAEERARLLSGVLLVYANGPMKLQRVNEPRAKLILRDALQAGPFLVDGGQTVAGLENARAARRSVVATDGAGHWAILTIDRVTLAGAAALLAAPGVLGEGRRIQRALNLDGGSSTGLWVRGAGGKAPHYSPEFGTVRNFLGVFPR